MRNRFVASLILVDTNESSTRCMSSACLIKLITEFAMFKEPSFDKFHGVGVKILDKYIKSRGSGSVVFDC